MSTQVQDRHAVPPNSISVPRPFHALIIGIQDYPSAPRGLELKGAIADAKAMKAYLVNLGISEEYIHTLYNEEATRQAIIKEFKHIKSSNSIKKGDPILIFFAGHGTSGAVSGGSSTVSKTQLILPYDYGPNEHGIPARTLGVLLDEMAKEKGDNITVILDCCFSGSATRRDDGEVRGVEGTQAIPPDLDQNIWEEDSDHRVTFVPSSFLMKGLRSHVLLTACGADETALEDWWSDDNGPPIKRGVFTVGLLKILEEVGANRITYTDLIQRIGSLDNGEQKPRCEGYHRRRIFFNDTTLGHPSVMYKIHKCNGYYVIDAGTLHGITPGVVFAVYNHQANLPTEIPVAFLKAHKVNHSLTTLTLASETFIEIGELAFAFQQAPPQHEALKIYVDENNWKNNLQGFIEGMGMGWIITNDAAAANLTLSMDIDGLVLTVNDERIKNHGLHSIPFRISFDPENPSKLELENLGRILRAAAWHHSHLWRENNVQGLGEHIEVVFTRLKPDPYDEEKLRPEGPNLIKDDKIDLIANEEIEYGIKITNNTDFYLYPYIFYFGSDLSIEDCYYPGVFGGKVDVAIFPNESLTIGYGPRGGNSISFTLDHRDDLIEEDEDRIDKGFQRTRQEVDVSFLKIFISTEPTDLRSILQHCPFGLTHRKTKKEKKKKDNPDRTALWHTFIIPLILRRSSQ